MPTYHACLKDPCSICGRSGHAGISTGSARRPEARRKLRMASLAEIHRRAGRKRLPIGFTSF